MHPTRGALLQEIAALFLLTLLFSAKTYAGDLIFEWAPDFSDKEKAITKKWISDYHSAIERQLIPYPFDIRIGFHRRERGATSLDIFGMTDRSKQQGIDFYIDSPKALSYDALMGEWTAPHELSHLLLPYIGRQHSWFAEGFASYMQYKVMADAGYISEKERWSRYRWNIEKAAKRYPFEKKPFIDMSQTLVANWDWPMVHWGGVAFFVNVEHALMEKDSSLTATLRSYVYCCRTNENTLENLLSELDKASKTKAFTQTYQNVKTQAGFPNYETALSVVKAQQLSK